VRVPGADMNAHYTFAALIALGMYGMENELELEIPPVSQKVDDAAKSIRLAKNLKEAADEMMKESSLARKTLGDDFVDHFGATRQHEWTVFSQTVTTWEIERYMELA